MPVSISCSVFPFFISLCGSTDFQKYDLDKLAEGLQQLQEDDLLQAVRIIVDHKTEDSYTKNDYAGK